MNVHQSLRDPLGVTVFGSHLLRTEPDHAIVSFAVHHLAAEPKAAIVAVEKTRVAVGAVLAARGLTPADITISQLGLELAVDGYGKDRRVLGYKAELGYTVRCCDLGVVAELVIELVDAGARTIRGVTYHTTRIRELRAQARQAAFASARVKALDYAGAAGLALGRVLHIEDVNPDQLSHRSHAPDIDLTAHDELAPGAAGSISIAGAVMVCFALIDA